MKKIILCLALAATTLAACNSNSNKSTKSQNSNKDTGTNLQTNDSTLKTSPVSDTKNTVSIKEIVNTYLQLKNAFADDNTNGAAAAGTALEAAFKNFNKTSLTVAQKASFDDIADDARENAEHIGKNGGNIEHQREHFELLSKDMYDLVKAFGSEQVLYKIVDPMFKNGKGAFWLNESKEIKNPYMGKAMPNSGSIQEEIK